MMMVIASLMVSALFSIFAAAAPSSYDQQPLNDVLEFLEHERTNGLIEGECRVGMYNVIDKMHGNGTDQSKLFARSYAVASYIPQRDRWIHRALACVRSSGGSFTQRGSPTKFCVGHLNASDDAERSTVGVCMPLDCSSQSSEHLLNTWEARTNNTGSVVDGDSSMCLLSRYDRQWYERPAALVNLSVEIVLLLFIIAASVALRVITMKQSSALQSLLHCFSITDNLRSICRPPGNDANSFITCLVGLRVLSLVWVILGHSYMVVPAFLSNVDEFRSQLVDNFFAQIVTNFTLAVDTFFVISGCLTAYYFFRKSSADAQQPKCCNGGFWLRFYRHRLVRLWPLYAWVLWTTTVRVSRNNFHPSWPPIDPTVQCAKSWWQNLLFLNSILENGCMNWTWYLGDDFLFFAVSPIFLLALKRSHRFGATLIAFVCGLSCVLRSLIMWQYRFPPTLMLWPQQAIFNPDFVEQFFKMYEKPYTRIGAYLVGIQLGYYLVRTKHSLIENNGKLSLKCRVIGWSVSTIVGSWCIFGLWPALQGWDWPVYHNVYGATHRTLFACCVAWLIFICHMQHGGFINSVLSAKIFVPFSNISYGCYIWHILPIGGSYLRANFPMHWHGHLYHLAMFLSMQLCLANIMALFTALIIEMPVLNIERFVDRHNHRRKTKDAMQLEGVAMPTGGHFAGTQIDDTECRTV